MLTRIGLFSPANRNPAGLAMSFSHGVKMTGAGCIYRLGLAAVLICKRLRNAIKRGDEWVFGSGRAL